jgi:antitoxin component of RelBE/YafQ-DinJ toxin-antitoxin module
VTAGKYRQPKPEEKPVMKISSICIKRIPTDVRFKFKYWAAVQGMSVTQAIIDYMEKRAKEVELPAKLRKKNDDVPGGS